MLFPRWGRCLRGLISPTLAHLFPLCTKPRRDDACEPWPSFSLSLLLGPPLERHLGVPGLCYCTVGPWLATSRAPAKSHEGNKKRTYKEPCLGTELAGRGASACVAQTATEKQTKVTTKTKPFSKRFQLKTAKGVLVTPRKLLHVFGLSFCVRRCWLLAVLVLRVVGWTSARGDAVVRERAVRR